MTVEVNHEPNCLLQTFARVCKSSPVSVPPKAKAFPKCELLIMNSTQVKAAPACTQVTINQKILPAPSDLL